jgi:agmatinase
MSNTGYDSFLDCDCPYESAEIALFGAPFDGTASHRPGARFAPAAMRTESRGMETFSPYQGRSLTDARVFDGGDIETPFGDPSAALSLIEERARGYLRDGKRPVMLGGDHLVTLGALRAAADAYPELRIIQFDAHADLRESYIGQRLSHATVIRRAHELVGDGKIYQFGIRSGEREEFEFASEHTIMRKFTLDGVDDAVHDIGAAPVYITIDLDVLDPSALPGTGTPEPGGVTFRELVSVIPKLGRLRVVGADIVELSPHYDTSAASTATACVVLREMLISIMSASRS